MTPDLARLCRSLLEQIDGARPASARTGEVPLDEYVSPDRFRAERQRVFRRTPVVVAVEAELAAAGASVASDVGGVPIVVVRGADGELRAFRNACRHRGAELVPSGAACTRKALVCPYHGWTYDLTGRRLRVTHQESFEGADAGRDALAPVHVAATGGFVLASLEPFDVRAFLGDLGDELGRWGLAGHTLFRRAVREVRANWKLVIDAFLEAYHIRHLHRDTVYPFFLDGQAAAERVGPHVRSITARRTAVEERESLLSSTDEAARRFVTPSYLVFPNTIVVVHPDYVSVVTLSPLAADRTRFTHAMLVPDVPRTAAEEAHFAKSFALIDEGVFTREDLGAAEAVQRGLEASSDATLIFGTLEFAALWFHEELDARLRDDAEPR